MGDADQEGMHLLMRDTHGRLTGFVDQVPLDSMPGFIKKHMEEGILDADHLAHAPQPVPTQAGGAAMPVVAIDNGHRHGVKVEQSP